MQKHNLERFINAQQDSYATALAEITNGQKESHWMWYIFPQLKGLGHSYYAQFYGIESCDEAEAYLAHPVLGARLREISNAILLHKEVKAAVIFGHTDAMKLKSSMTLFDFVCPNDVFAEVLQVFYDGKKCRKTLRVVDTRQIDIKPTTIKEALKYIGVDAVDFSLENRMFDRPCHSALHGIGHIYRVMVGCALLGEMAKSPREALLAFCGAYIHDLARSNDGIEPSHGENAAKYHFTRFNHLWDKYALTEEERKFVCDAVTYHSQPPRTRLSDKGYRVLAILKDADALDRCRLGDLNPMMLRYEESLQLISVIADFYNKSYMVNSDTPFDKFINILE